MKRKLCIAVLTLCIAASMAACGSNSDKKDKDTTKTESTDSAQKEETKEDKFDGRLVSVDDVDKYVTIGDYKGLNLDRTVEEVTDDLVDSQITQSLKSNASEVGDANAQIQKGDIANINYVGKKDGEAFDGGTADNYDLEIGSGSFIDGFEDGLIGAKKGDTLDLNLTFPDEYPSDELAGQDVVFTVTVNSIKRPGELTDEWVKANTDFSKAQEYRASVKAQLEDSAKQAAETNLRNTAWTAVTDSSEVKEYPQEDLDRAAQVYKDQVEVYAQQANMTLEQLLESQGMDEDTFEEQATQFAEYKVKQNLIVQSILDKEGMSLEDEACDSIIDKLVSNYSASGITSKEELISQFGERSVYETVGIYYVTDLIMDNAKITDKISSAGEEVINGDVPEEEAGAENSSQEETAKTE